MRATTDGLTIAEGGSSPYRIVLPARPSPSQRHAADELVRFVREMSGAALPVVSERSPGTDREIVLGATNRLRPAGVRVDWRRLGDEGYQLQTAGTSLFIAGSPVRGTLYGVYGLLADVWGCRWYTPTVSRVPRRPVLRVPRMARIWIPKLEYRESYWTEGFDGDWAARNRQNSALARLEDRHGGKIVYEGFVHTMWRWVPEKLFARHPEYFALRDGKRHGGLAQRCLTHPDVLRITIANVRKALRANPKANIVSVSQNDNQEYCECDRCRALDAREGSHAGTLLAFVNAVAKAIEREFPRVAVDTLAYQYTRQPPRSIRPRPNVIVRLCTIECCFAHPLDGCPEASNTSLVRDLKGWGRLTRRLYVWDYTTDFVHYLLPFPDLDVLDANVRTFVRHGVAGIFEQGNYSRGGVGAQAELKAWVLARLLVDPSLAVGPLIAEFIRGVYGPAAGAVRSAVDRLRREIRASGEHVRIFDGPDRAFLAPAVLRGCDRDLARAERIARRDPDRDLPRRVERLRMMIWYARLAAAIEPRPVLAEARRRLRAAIPRQGLTNLTEWRALELDWPRVDLAPFRRRFRPAVPGTIVAGNHLFKLWGGQHPALLVRDPRAGDGVAVRQPGASVWGSWQWDLPTAGPPGRYRVRVRIRVEKKGNAGPAFGVGVYDLEPRGTVGEATVRAREIPDSRYHWYDLGEVELGPARYASCSPAGNTASIGAVLTDRFELVPAGR